MRAFFFFKLKRKLFPLWQGEMKSFSLISFLLRWTSVSLDSMLTLCIFCFLSNSCPLNSPTSIFLLISPSSSQRGSSDSHSSKELPTQGSYRGLCPSSSGSEASVQELFEEDIYPQMLEQSPAQGKGTELSHHHWVNLWSALAVTCAKQHAKTDFKALF